MTSRIVLCLISMIAFASAQEGRAIRRPVYPPNGQVRLDVHPLEYVVSLEQLVDMSKLIVDGTVLSNLPAVSANPALALDRPDLETHSLVSVTSVIAGKIPAGSSTILLAQPGGKDSRWDISVPADPLVKPGDRYILFLTPDDRKEPKNLSGVPRYTAVGMWAGKVKVQDDHVRLLPASNAAPKLQLHDNTLLSEFIATVNGIVNHTVIPEKRNAIPHPGLPTQK